MTQRLLVVCAKKRVGKKKKANEASREAPQPAKRIKDTNAVPLKAQLGFEKQQKAAAEPPRKLLVRSSYRRVSDVREDAFAESPTDSCDLPSPNYRTPRPASQLGGEAWPGQRGVLLVDGYNVIFSAEPIGPFVLAQSEAGEDIVYRRDMLLQALKDFRAYRGMDVVVAFDAYIGGRPGRYLPQDGLEVVFYSEGQADKWIVEEVKRLKDAGVTTVVVATSDNDLRSDCGESGAAAMTSAALITDLERVKEERLETQRQQFRRSALASSTLGATLLDKSPGGLEALWVLAQEAKAQEAAKAEVQRRKEEEQRRLRLAEQQRALAELRLPFNDLELRNGVVVPKSGSYDRENGAGGNGTGPGHGGENGVGGSAGRGQRQRGSRKYEGHAGFDELGRRAVELENVVVDDDFSNDGDERGLWFKERLAGALRQQKPNQPRK